MGGEKGRIRCLERNAKRETDRQTDRVINMVNKKKILSLQKRDVTPLLLI